MEPAYKLDLHVGGITSTHNEDLEKFNNFTRPKRSIASTIKSTLLLITLLEAVTVEKSNMMFTKTFFSAQPEERFPT